MPSINYHRLIGEVTKLRRQLQRYLDRATGDSKKTINLNLKSLDTIEKVVGQRCKVAHPRAAMKVPFIPASRTTVASASSVTKRRTR
jgi:hypothetical protein